VSRRIAAVVLSGALSLAIPGAGQAQGPSPQVINVELSSFAFSPSALTFQHGRTYRLHLVNTSGGGHDFTAPEFFAASQIAPADRVRVAGGKVKLAGKQSVDVTLTPEKAGIYALHCSHFLHAGMGMKGAITVE
jgi:plastocyanin